MRRLAQFVRLCASARVSRLSASVCVCLFASVSRLFTSRVPNACACTSRVPNACVCVRLCASVCVRLRLFARVCVCVRLFTSRVPNACVCLASVCPCECLRELAHFMRRSSFKEFKRWGEVFAIVILSIPLSFIL